MNANTFRREKGLHAWAVEIPESGDLMFRIGWQCVDAGRESELADHLKGGTGNLCISIAGCTGLMFCPWCGKKLARHYRSMKHLVLDKELEQRFEPQNQAMHQRPGAASRTP
jgi:hypothetical protein